MAGRPTHNCYRLKRYARSMAGSSFKGEIQVMKFFYTYVLLCADGDWYIGSTDDLWCRIREHEKGKVTATSYRRPIELVYFEACHSLNAARIREKQLKSGFGRGYLNRRLEFELHRSPVCPNV